MSAHFILELDTTGPIIIIDAPTFVALDQEITITINSSENISANNMHELYIIDRLDNRHDIDYTVYNNKIVSTLTLQDLDIHSGSARLYAQLYDEVYNPSSLANQALNVEVPTIENIINFKGILSEHQLKGIIDKETELLGEINKIINLEASVNDIELKGIIKKLVNLKGKIGGDS